MEVGKHIQKPKTKTRVPLTYLSHFSKSLQKYQRNASPIHHEPNATTMMHNGCSTRPVLIGLMCYSVQSA